MVETKVGGDQAGGWLVEVHDGDRHGTYSPEAATAEEAEQKALAQHAATRPPPELSLEQLRQEFHSRIDGAVDSLKGQIPAPIDISGNLTRLKNELKADFDKHVDDVARTVGKGFEAVFRRLAAVEKAAGIEPPVEAKPKGKTAKADAGAK